MHWELVSLSGDVCEGCLTAGGNSVESNTFCNMRLTNIYQSKKILWPIVIPNTYISSATIMSVLIKCKELLMR